MDMFEIVSYFLAKPYYKMEFCLNVIKTSSHLFRKITTADVNEKNLLSCCKNQCPKEVRFNRNFYIVFLRHCFSFIVWSSYSRSSLDP